MENNSKPMTLKEVIAETHKLLQEVTIPVTMIDQVGRPVLGAINNLRLCLQAIERDEAEASAAPELVEEIQTEPVEPEN